MIYHQLALTLDAATRDPKPKSLPPTSHTIVRGGRVYNCSECMASRSVVQTLTGYKCTECGQTFYQTRLDL